MTVNETVVPQVVRSYLEQLRTALRDVPEEVSCEIVAGIGEELAGLDAATATARIEELGDPAFIAAEARAGVGPVASASVVVETRLQDPRWYFVVAALLVAIGGVVVPVLGWIVGIAMVWLSKTWRTWEKWVATLTPLMSAVLAALVVAVANGVFAPPSRRYWSGPPGSEVPANPVLPTWTDVTMSSMLFLALVGVIVGIWLLWRALRPSSGQLTHRER